MSERIKLHTSDGIEIIGTYFPGTKDRFVIFLHMMPATKESWGAWINKLSLLGYHCLAIDERGHGESTMEGTLRFQEFTDNEQQQKIFDVEAAFSFLEELGAKEESTIVIGGSIGANLAIQFLQQHPCIKLAIALSPGIDYHGIVTDEPIKHLATGQKVVVIASDEDVGSFKTIQKLKKLNPEHVEKIELFGTGHATRITDAHPELIDEWISQFISFL
ncbi:MAG: Alpha/beta hydrolase fold protein [Candidatus Uhrbacteria bacterium GW2011_GWE2_40_58]|nr:MAG: Alpha/beta hydrolase fold protein [Candidatus Uhrbacteria bacterium GW2011_GWF2_40_263]KKR68118.1 MAG: Alpha/beta hydrolase fold protein [Candidatus Uhrbacteria bacterium GW2011_GWE2_40_58]OGL91818.1 MAG: hypothetical protein A2239_04640 [Candidatus Uhrbacteria bacterium RIFOXYA2_FULL_40_9]OGL97268.1 MAG: hypothetical protein A2332_01615 [Candidatus Uhrbacteria bacterium RIFOXYB2_FULL_41_18]HBK34424.1 hypothetical protein [Candidatus Uhrbacteria bacterium]